MLFREKWVGASFCLETGHTVCSNTMPHAEII